MTTADIALEPHPHTPQDLTSAGWMFESEYHRLTEFVFYVTELAEANDKKARIAAKALWKDDDPEEYQRAIARIEKHGTLQALRKKHSQLIVETMLCRSVENFLTYLSDLLALVFRARPETLKSSETVRVDYVLQHATMDELVHRLAERRVHELSYRGLRDLLDYVASRLGLVLVTDDAALARIVRAVESRNLLVHNRGVVNEVFLQRVASAVEKVGSRVVITSDDVFNDLSLFARIVYDSDSRAATKFGLPAGPEPKPAA